MRKQIEKYINLIIDHPKTSLLITALITIFFMTGLPKIQFDTSFEFLMPKEDPAYKLGERTNYAFLKEKTFLVTSIEPAPGHELFSEETFAHINNMVEEMEEYRTFNRSLEDSRLSMLIESGNVSINETQENIEKATKTQVPKEEENDDLEDQLDKLILEENSSENNSASDDEKLTTGNEVENLIQSSKTDNTDLWDLDNPLPEDEYAEPTRERRDYNYSLYSPVSLHTLRTQLDATGQRQLDSVIIASKIEVTDENEKLSKSNFTDLLETWETAYLFKSIEIIHYFMNPITGEDISGSNEELKPIDFVLEDSNGAKILPKSKEDFEEYRSRIKLNPLNKINFFSTDENGKIQAFSSSIILKNIQHYNKFMDVFWPVLSKYDTKPVKLYSMGSLVIEKYMGDFMRTDLRLYLPLVLLFVILTFFLNFRSVRGVLLPTITVIIGAIWTMGLMGHLGFKMSMLVSILPPLLIAIGSSYSIHMFNQYLSESNLMNDYNKREKLKKSMAHISVTIFLAAITTFISFMTLSISQVTSLRDFGIFSAFGALLSTFAAFLLIPASLALLKTLKYKENKTGTSHSKNGLIYYILNVLSNLSINKTRPVMIVFTILFIFGVVGLTKIKTETSPMYNFQQDSYIRKADNRIGELFNGTFALNLVFDSGKINGAKDPEFLQYIDRVKQWLAKPEQRENHNILSSASFGDFIKRMHMAVNNDDPKFFKIPDDKQTISDYLEVFSGDDRNSDGRADGFEQFVDTDYQKVNLFIRTGTYKDRVFSTSLNREIKDVVLAKVSEFDNPNGYTWFMSGSGINIIVLADYILRGQITSVILSLIVIALLIFVLFKKIAASFVSIIPITMGITMVYGLMGYLGIVLDIPKVILSSIAIGIGIDDTIHFMKTLSHHMQNGLSLNKALKATYNEAGLAISYTSVALIFGFSILTLSNFRPIFYLGILVAGVMFATTIGALLFLPAFIKTLNLRIREIEITHSTPDEFAVAGSANKLSPTRKNKSAEKSGKTAAKKQ